MTRSSRLHEPCHEQIPNMIKSYAVYLFGQADGSEYPWKSWIPAELMQSHYILPQSSFLSTSRVLSQSFCTLELQVIYHI